MITVYVTQHCFWCQRIKAFLNAHGLHFKEIDLSDDEEGRAELMKRTGLLTFPQVFRDDDFLGGCQEAEKILLTGGVA